MVEPLWNFRSKSEKGLFQEDKLLNVNIKVLKVNIKVKFQDGGASGIPIKMPLGSQHCGIAPYGCQFLSRLPHFPSNC